MKNLLQKLSSRCVAYFASSILALNIISASAAQQVPAYTWEQFQDLLVRTNPILRAQEQAIISSRADELSAALRPNPTVQNDTSSSTLGIYQEFEIGGKRTARIRSSKLATTISQNDTDDLRRTLSLNLRQAFVAALQANSVLQFAQENLVNYQRAVDIDRQMLQQGEIARADFLRIELQMVQFQTDVEDANLQLKTAKATLRGLVGAANLPGDFEVQGDLKAEPFNKDLEELKKLAIQNRPDLKSAETAKLKAAADVNLARANRWPDPTVGVSFLHTGTEFPGPQWFEPFYPKGSAVSAMGVGVASIPLPLFNRNQGEIARTKSEELRTGLLVQAANNQVIQDVESAYTAFLSARNRLRMYEDTYLAEAKESLDIEEFSFHQGGASILDYLDAQRTYRATQLAYRQQLAAYITALAQLESAAGLPITP